MKRISQNGIRPIMEWIYAGPYEKDVSRLYENNYSVPIEPYLFLMEEAESKLPSCLPAEGEAMELFGESRRWAYKRADPSETKLTWAGFGTYARCLATYACNEIAVKQDGRRRFRLWAAGSISIWINGNKVFGHRRVGRTEGEFCFEADLREGVNLCQVLLFNVHLHCMNSFTLMLEEDQFQVRLPLLLDAASREWVEGDLAKFYLERFLLQEQDPLVLTLQEPLASAEYWSVSVFKGKRGEREGEAPVWEDTLNIPKDAREIHLCSCRQLHGPGEYVLCVDYIAPGGERIEGMKLAFYLMAFMAQLPEGDYARRKQFLMKRYAGCPHMERKEREGVYRAFVRLRADPGAPPDIAAIEQAIDYINCRYDCADFALHGLLRVYYRYRGSNVLPQELKEAMKQCILGFKYWEDEPGRSMMFTRSENHEILFFSAQYLAGLLFPAERFINSGQNGLFHIQKGRAMAERWIKEKGSYGFMEWHSNTYFEEDMLALLNLYDFGEETGYIRILARQLLDFICFLISTHSYKGVMGTTHGRCYEETVIHPELEAMSHINWLLFGLPEALRDDRLSIGAVALMDSAYAPHPALERIARSPEEVHTLTRMGLFPHEGLGGVNCSAYRTGDYMVSGLVESMKGRHGHQVQAGQVLLDGNIPIFVTCFDNKSETTRPSYWGGQYRMPKTIAYKNVLAYIYQIDEIAGFTHCYFPIEQFDEIYEAGNWLLGRKYNAYAAVYSLEPYVRTEAGKYKNRELLCFHKRNIWLIEAGSREQFGSFSGFISGITGASLVRRGNDLIYDSPSVGQLRLSWEEPCTVGGQAVPGRDFPLVQNSFAAGEYGSGLTYLHLDGQRKILNFNM